MKHAQECAWFTRVARTFAVACGLAMALCALPGHAAALSGVKYLDETGTERTTEAAELHNGLTSLSGGWYVLSNNVNVSGLEVSGDVHLILGDRRTLNVSDYGIDLEEGSSLTIYAQSTGGNTMGSIISHGSSYCGIEMVTNETGPQTSLTINGGSIYAESSYHCGIGAPIGGYDCGDITINGGIVRAVAGTFGVGIGGPSYDGKPCITINGGEVVAEGCGDGAGVGTVSRYEFSGSVIVNEGLLEAIGGDNAPGIGGGSWGATDSEGLKVASGVLEINGGVVRATGGSGYQDLPTSNMSSWNGFVLQDGVLEKFGGMSKIDFTLEVMESEELVIDDAFEFSITDGGKIVNYGTVTNEAQTFTIEDGCVVENHDTWNDASTTFNVNETGKLINHGTFTNGKAYMEFDYDATLDNAGHFINYGQIRNKGTYTQSGTFENHGYFAGFLPDGSIGHLGSLGNLGSTAPGTGGSTEDPDDICTVAIEPEDPDPGDTVTVIPSAGTGYEVREVTVVAEDGSELPVTDNGDGTWSFTMPATGEVEVCTIFACDGGELCPSAGFADVDQGLWYHDAIDWAVEEGVLSGYTGTDLMGPDNVVTRAQLAAMLSRIEGAEDGDAGALAGYADVDQDGWYVGCLAWAVEEGLFFGYTGTDLMGPDDALTREQTAAVLMRWAEGRGEDTSARADLSAYPDVVGVSSWATGCMSWAVAEGVLSGVELPDGTRELASTQSCTRAQLAAMLMDMMEA